ncbi:MAG: DUF4160 domain-containing protein [Verrucomicrobiales bacterium]|nr:DUF4160 domain-containing protein [Verrucomicrobiales bacterium]
MPELARFYGIIIRLRYSEHPPPHFHVKYQEHNAAFDIQNLTMIKGWLPARAKSMVLEWASQHRAELLTAWRQAAAGRIPDKIAPLE